ncbi:hypothetical protein EYF80_004535 [Liparis tanakae]|uniref:Uncharacterized protein n=1 Tax=Liparis tanakae TaxID=230148 RepID=A0A4Z2J4A7_9TELE|nr:hypothetical protein EYF80_004535 [Liparis tanakae]
MQLTVKSIQAAWRSPRSPLNDLRQEMCLSVSLPSSSLPAEYGLKVNCVDVAKLRSTRSARAHKPCGPEDINLPSSALFCVASENLLERIIASSSPEL